MQAILVRCGVNATSPPRPLLRLGFAGFRSTSRLIPGATSTAVGECHAHDYRQRCQAT